MALATLPVAADCRAAAESAARTEPIVVTAQRPPLPPAESARTVVITREQIERLPARSVEEVLLDLAGVDVRRRGPGGVQADVGIRGATFEQTLVLIDGVRVADPQTGHHNLDLPVSLADIERIEVLKGPGARALGANAFGGVINIVTRRPAGRGLELRAEGGSHGYVAAGGAAGADAGGFAGRLTASGSRSDGHRPNTDHEITTAGIAAALPGGVRLLAGRTDKEFGANGFYSDRFPNQRETTRTSFASAGADLGSGSLVVSPRLSWRRHDDHYLLDFERPAFYENRHRTDVGAVGLESRIESAAGSTLLGGELAQESIDSSSLGDYRRLRGGLHLNHRAAIGSRVSLAAGAYASYHDDWGWEAWPGADLTVALGGARLFLSIDRAYRVPTYTELYYKSPANLGNPDLAPEEAWTQEAGIEWRGGGHRIALSVFHRVAEQLIDWVRSTPDQPWQVQNRTGVITDGVEVDWAWRPGLAGGALEEIGAGYAFLDSTRDAEGLESRYALDHLRHQATLRVGHALPFGLWQIWRVVWEERLGSEDHLVVDTRIRRPFARGEFFAEATNLFDAKYTEVGGVPQPGVLVSAGVKLDFGPW